MQEEEAIVLERARVLESLKLHPGWKIIEEYFNETRQDTVSNLLQYRGSDPHVERSLRLQAKITGDIHDEIHDMIEETIMQAKEILLQTASEENQL